VLLWLFAFLIGRSLTLGERFSCFCFGESDSQLSRWTLARTAALALLASELVIVAPAAALRAAPLEESALEAAAGLSLLGVIVLLGQLRRIRRWDDRLLVRDTAVAEVTP
jgi:hypothetical protein